MAESLYQAQILDHYKHPRNKGRLDPATFQSVESNPLCGDTVSLYLRVDGANRITDVRFDGEGCAISQASASMLTTLLEGKTLDEAKAVSKEELLRALGVRLSEVRIQCALLPLNSLRSALAAAGAARGP